MKKCPFCAEEIQDEAIVCRYCGRDLVTKPVLKQVSKPAKEPTPAAVLAFPIGILVTIFQFEYHLIFDPFANFTELGVYVLSTFLIFTLIPAGLIEILRRLSQKYKWRENVQRLGRVVLYLVYILLVALVVYTYWVGYSVFNSLLGMDVTEQTATPTAIQNTPIKQAPTSKPIITVQKTTSTPVELIQPTARYECLSWEVIDKNYIGDYLCVYTNRSRIHILDYETESGGYVMYVKLPGNIYTNNQPLDVVVETNYYRYPEALQVAQSSCHMFWGQLNEWYPNPSTWWNAPFKIDKLAACE